MDEADKESPVEKKGDGTEWVFVEKVAGNSPSSQSIRGKLLAEMLVPSEYDSS